MSPTDHMALDLSAFRTLEIKNGDWTLVTDAEIIGQWIGGPEPHLIAGLNCTGRPTQWLNFCSFSFPA